MSFTLVLYFYMYSNEFTINECKDCRARVVPKMHWGCSINLMNIITTFYLINIFNLINSQSTINLTKYQISTT